MDVAAEDRRRAAGRFQQLSRAAQPVPGPVRDPAGAEGSVMDEDDLAAEILAQLRIDDPALRDHRPAHLAARVERREAVGQRARREVLLEQAVGLERERVAIVVSGDADQPLAERRQRVSRQRELLLHRELRQIAGADDQVGAQGIGIADDLAKGGEGAVVVAPPALPELDRRQRAQRPEIPQRPLAPAGQLHVGIGEVQDPHGFSAIASSPSPPSVSSMRSMRSPADSSAVQSDSAEERP